jgi:hypothetical protein
MREKGAKYILAIDVGSEDDMEYYYGDSLSAHWLWWNWLPFHCPVKGPSIYSISQRLASICHKLQLTEISNARF